MLKRCIGLVSGVLAAACTTLPPAQTTGREGVLGDRVKQLTRASQWRAVASIPVQFNTQHPRGMVR